MANQPFGARPAIPKAKGASAVPGILFIVALAAAFWIGAVWASQAWFG